MFEASLVDINPLIWHWASVLHFSLSFRCICSCTDPPPSWWTCRHTGSLPYAWFIYHHQLLVHLPAFLQVFCRLLPHVGIQWLFWVSVSLISECPCHFIPRSAVDSYLHSFVDWWGSLPRYSFQHITCCNSLDHCASNGASSQLILYSDCLQ